MLFSSLTFLYAFLPLTLLAYARCRDMQQRNKVLLISSLIFYIWGEPLYVLLLLGMSLADWFIALKIEQSEDHTLRRLWLAAACIINIGLIGIFKYSGLVFSLFGDVPEFIKNIALPLGISFYTFQLLSYVADVFRGDAVAQKEYKNVLLYAALFHQCIAGPIVRYKTISEELFVKRNELDSLADGVYRFAIGLGKKVLLGNVCGELADALLLSDAAISGGTSIADAVAQLSGVPVVGVWLGMFAYMLHIYLDFSGYSDMAIGLGLMVGLHYPENFNYPYISKSVTEFWRRWHISLSTFFRDYVYIPLGGSRRGLKRTLINLFIVWALTGLWHGASFTFMLWGIYYFAFLVLEKLYLKDKLEKLPKFVPWLYTMLVVFFGWTIFKFTDMHLLGTVFKGMLGLNGNPFMSFQVKLFFENRVFILLVSMLFCTPLFKKLDYALNALTAGREKLTIVYRTVHYCIIPAVILVLSTAMLVGNSYNPFIYFHF